MNSDLFQAAVRIIETAGNDDPARQETDTGVKGHSQAGMLPAVFVVSLERSPERYAFMARQLQDLGIPFRKVSAVDGKKLIMEELQQIYDPELTQKNIGRLITKEEIGCYLSHWKIYKIMTEENLPEALVLEDDVVLDKDIIPILKAWDRMPPDCRLLQMGTSWKIESRKKNRFSHLGNIHFPLDYIAVRNYDICYGTMAYIIRRSLASELLELLLPIKLPIDDILFDWRYNYYIPWFLYKKSSYKPGQNLITVGEHLDENSLIRKERGRLQYAARKKIRPRKFPFRGVLREWWYISHRIFKKIFPLPLNRGRKKSLLDVTGALSPWQHILVSCSSLALPGRNKHAKAIRTKSRPHIFLINLKHDKQRLKFMEQQLEKMHLSFEVIEGVDGGEIPPEELEKIYDPALSMEKFHRQLLPGEIGCYLSHMKVYRTMCDRNLPECLVLEDDVAVDEEFSRFLNGYDVPKEYQVLQLVTGQSLNIKGMTLSRYRSITLPNRYRVSRRVGTVYGTQAYMIRQDCARRLLQQEHSIQVPIDVLLFDWGYNFYLPWIVYKKNGKMLGTHKVRIGTEKPIAYGPKTKRELKTRIKHKLVETVKLMATNYILCWIWPWNPGQKVSLLQFKGKPNILQYARVIRSFYVPPPFD